MKEYLEKQNFAKNFDKLCEKLKKKKVIIYGTGKLFQEIVKNYDLKKLNIVGVTDRKYILEDEGKIEFGYKVIPLVKLNDFNADCILIATQKYFALQNTLKKIFPQKMVIPLVQLNWSESIKDFINKISLFKYIQEKKSNTIVLIKANGKKIYSPKIKNLEIDFTGKNNYVEIHEPFFIEKKVYITGNSDNKIVINSNNRYKFTKIIMGSRNSLYIGKNTTTVGLEIHMFSAIDKTITIGDDCLFAWDVMVRTADAHTVYDINTNEVINPGKDVIIGNHVWVTANCTILKGSKIASNCMVGTGSILNKEYNEENCMLVGAPAKVVKRGINWDRRGVCEFAK